MKEDSKIRRFEEACIQIRERDGVEALLYNLKGKNKDKVVTLKSPYSRIAAKYLYYERNIRGKIFSWQQITDACILADLYVTDVVSHHL